MNDGKRMATSTLLAIMGRMAAYTGQQVTWDEALNSQEKLFPEHLEWEGHFPDIQRPGPACHRKTGLGAPGNVADCS